MSNVFAFLRVSFKGEHSQEKGSQEQSEVAKERVHTPTSLFSRLRITLDAKSLLTKAGTLEELESLHSGHFVEFRAILKKNPLVENIERFQRLMEMAELFSDEPSQPKRSGGKGQGKKGSSSPQPRNENEQIAQQMQGILTALTQSGSLETIGEMIDVPSARAVLSTKPEFFSDQNALEIIDGEFRVLGKVIRIVRSDSKEAINLLRKTSFGRIDERVFEHLGEGFQDHDDMRISFPELVTKIEGPALQVVPIAIFT